MDNNLMTRNDLLRRLVLNELSDDYENLEHITVRVQSLEGQCGLKFTRAEYVSAVVELINLELVKAYRVSPMTTDLEAVGLPPLAEMDRCYFWQTEKGRIMNATEPWPIDDDGHLLQGFEIERGE